MTEIRGTKPTPQTGLNARTGGPTGPGAQGAGTGDAAPPPPAPDRAALSAGARSPGKIGLGTLPAAAAPGQTFTSQGAKPPTEAGERVAVTTTTSDFEVQTQWDQRGGKLALTGVGVLANDQGDFVTVDEQGGVKLGGEPLVVDTGAPVDLPGGGMVSRGVDGGVGVRSSKGDNVTITAANGKVGYRAVLSGSRAADTVVPGGSED